MARSHIEFVYTQNLPWTEPSPSSWGAADRVKRLSADAESGEETLIAAFERDWAGELGTVFQEEIFVLDGAVTLGGETLRRDGYARLPAGLHLACSAEAGTVVAVFRNREVDAPEDPVIVDTTALPWDRSFVPEEMNFMGAVIKPLYVDATDGGLRTWLISVAPHAVPIGIGLALETHGCAEEALMLAGDITGPHGVMSAGAYFWRPKDTLHGPFGSRSGGLGLLRFREGEQSTIYHDETLPFRFEPEYRPVLPPEWSDQVAPAAFSHDRY